MGRTINPADLVRVERLNDAGRRLTLQALARREFHYLVMYGGGGKETLTALQIRPLFEEVAKAQEKDATRTRITELIDRIYDRTWNRKVIYLNRSTGEVTS